MPTGVYERTRLPAAVAYARKLESNRKSAARSKYGLTIDQADAIRAAGCALHHLGGCGGRVCVDHCHDTGRVRGGLCRRHNAMLSLVEHHPDALQIIGSYLAAA